MGLIFSFHFLRIFCCFCESWWASYDAVAVFYVVDYFADLKQFTAFSNFNGDSYVATFYTVSVVSYFASIVYFSDYTSVSDYFSVV